jgi:hypothetical protein
LNGWRDVITKKKTRTNESVSAPRLAISLRQNARFFHHQTFSLHFFLFSFSSFSCFTAFRPSFAGLLCCSLSLMDGE